MRAASAPGDPRQRGGLIGKGRRPRNRFFLWSDPGRKNDLVLFLGEARPPVGTYVFCRQLIAYAQEIGVERVFTFAAMATEMHPEEPSRVFGAATDEATSPPSSGWTWGSSRTVRPAA